MHSVNTTSYRARRSHADSLIRELQAVRRRIKRAERVMREFADLGKEFPVLLAKKAALLSQLNPLIDELHREALSQLSAPERPS